MIWTLTYPFYVYALKGTYRIWPLIYLEVVEENKYREKETILLQKYLSGPALTLLV